MPWTGHSLRLALSTFLPKWEILRVLGIAKSSGIAFTYFPKTNFLCCRKIKAPNCCNQLLKFQVIFSGTGGSPWTIALWGRTTCSHWIELSYPDRAVENPLSVWHHNSPCQEKCAACPAAPQNRGRGSPLRACSTGIATPLCLRPALPMPAAGGTHPCGTGPAAAASRVSARGGDPQPTRGCSPATTASMWPLCIRPHLQAALQSYTEPLPGGNSTFLTISAL